MRSSSANSRRSNTTAVAGVNVVTVAHRPAP